MGITLASSFGAQSLSIENRLANRAIRSVTEGEVQGLPSIVETRTGRPIAAARPTRHRQSDLVTVALPGTPSAPASPHLATSISSPATGIEPRFKSAKFQRIRRERCRGWLSWLRRLRHRQIRDAVVMAKLDATRMDMPSLMQSSFFIKLPTPRGP